jgi:hypothetical protein
VGTVGAASAGETTNGGVVRAPTLDRLRWLCDESGKLTPGLRGHPARLGVSRDADRLECEPMGPSAQGYMARR